MIIKRQPYNLLQQLTLWQLRQRICNQNALSSDKACQYYGANFLHNTGCLGVCKFKNITHIKKDETAKNKFRQGIEQKWVRNMLIAKDTLNEISRSSWREYGSP